MLEATGKRTGLIVLPHITSIAARARPVDALAGRRATAAAAGLEPTGPVGALYDDELFTQDAGHARVYLPVRDSPALDGMGAHWELPPGRFAVALHVGVTPDVTRWQTEVCWPLAPAGAQAN
jgi:hypothetical protein